MNIKPFLYVGIPIVVIMGIVGKSVNRPAQALRRQVGQLANDTTKVVTVGAPRAETLEDTAEISGNVTTSQDVQVGFKASGKIIAVNVGDGDRVSAGQVIASLDTSTIYPQLQQAQAQVQQALANLAQQQTNATLSPGRTIAAVHQAEAGLRSARAGLTKALAGARTEERLQAQAQVASAQSDVKTTTSELNRVKILVKEGALAGNRLEQQQNLVDQAQSRLRNAQESLNTLTNGTRTEDIAVAREAVRQAQAQLQNAQASRSLDATLRDQVNAARAQVESAQALVRVQQQALADAQLRAPISGRVLGRPLQAGSVVSPGTQVVRIIGEGGVYFEGQVPSARIAVVQPGQDVLTTVDALPGRTFQGRIASVDAQGQTSGRVFNARITFAGDASAIRPGMFARGTVVIRRIVGALTVPTSALVSDGGKNYVVLDDGGKAKRVEVKTGIVVAERTQVEGIAPDAGVVVAGASGLFDGDRLRTESPSGGAAKSPVAKSPVASGVGTPPAHPQDPPLSAPASGAEGAGRPAPNRASAGTAGGASSVNAGGSTR